MLNGKRIEYDLQRKDVKNINLRIKSDRTIFLSANPRVSEEVIEEDFAQDEVVSDTTDTMDEE